MRRTAVEAAAGQALAGAPFCSPGRTIVAALSGGPDSVALLDALVTLSQAHGFSVVAAHLDHRLRDDSAADAAFCRRLCERLAVPLHAASTDVRQRARREGGGIEQAARRARYAFLRSVKAETGADAIAIAHTSDDQAETVLIRLLRGSGRTGLGAMRPRSADLVRPLLGVSRRQVMAHLRLRRLPWREDPTNSDTRLLRNRVRLELIPYLESRFNPAVRGTLARAASVLAAEQDLLDSMAAELLPRVARAEGASMAVDRAALATAPEALARLVLRRCLRAAGGLRGVGRVHVERLLALARARGASGRRLALPGRREALVRFGELWIGPAAPAWAAFEAALAVPGHVALPDGSVLTARESAGPDPVDGWTVVALPDEPLVVRTRRPGDRVRSAGRDRSLKRILLEGRVPADERERMPLVAAGARVVWFPGMVAEPPEATPGGVAQPARNRVSPQGPSEGIHFRREPPNARYVALAVEPAGARA